MGIDGNFISLVLLCCLAFITVIGILIILTRLNRNYPLPRDKDKDKNK